MIGFRGIDIAVWDKMLFDVKTIFNDFIHTYTKKSFML